MQGSPVGWDSRSRKTKSRIMRKTLRFGISAAALAAAIGTLAAPAFADHHGGLVPGGNGNSGNANNAAPAVHSGGGDNGNFAPSGDASGVHESSGGGSSDTHKGGSWVARDGVHAARAHFFNKGQNFAQFNPAQRQTWTHGHWWHGHHHGHDGWWWFAGGSWFYYPFAVYPYPDYVSAEAEYYDDAPGQTWWYCPNPA